MLELVKGKMYRQKVNSLQGYEDWEYTGITKEVPNGELWYAFKNDRGCYYFDKTDLGDFVEIKMTKQEIKKRIADLNREIRYEKRKMECCAYGTSDLRYLDGLVDELVDLKNQLAEMED